MHSITLNHNYNYISEDNWPYYVYYILVCYFVINVSVYNVKGFYQIKLIELIYSVELALVFDFRENPNEVLSFVQYIYQYKLPVFNLLKSDRDSSLWLFFFCKSKIS